MSQQEVVHAYRHLLRASLRAVQFSKPARYIAVDKLRDAFRDKKTVYNAEGIKRTRWFLEGATRCTGPEHRILKNLIHVHFERQKVLGRRWKPKPKADKKKAGFLSTTDLPTDAYHHFDMTVAMLNNSMGTLLR